MSSQSQIENESSSLAANPSILDSKISNPVHLCLSFAEQLIIRVKVVMGPGMKY